MTGPTTPAGVTALEHVFPPHQMSREGLRLTYLRRKPGRGLVAVYAASGDPSRIYTARIEDADASRQAFLPGGAGAEWTEESQGLAARRDLGVTVETFPVDRKLPGLAAAMAPEPHTPVRAALESVARRQLRLASSCRVLSASAQPLRYKPGDRCVIRYQLSVELPSSGRPCVVSHGVIGKLYRDSSQAATSAELLRRLADLPWAPRPLTVVEPLPLLLVEDVGSADDDPPAVEGTDMIRCTVGQPPPAATLRAAATALAGLHASGSLEAGTPVRTGVDEAAKAVTRAGVLSAYAPQLRAEIERVRDRLHARLVGLPADVQGPAHGSFKPSQLLFRDGSVFVVDFDQFCRADPALDVGYFLAYLRPPGLWYGRRGTRAWFEAAAGTFLSAYDDALRQRGIDLVTRSGIRGRCSTYEAALLLKIAARRPNRLQSPRPGEITSMLEEITCLTGPVRG